MTGIGGDERRIRQLLHARGVGYAPQTPPPAAGWWDALYDDDHQDHHRPETPPPAAPRLPDWRKGEQADLGGDRPDAESEPPEKPTAAPAIDDEEDEGEEWEDVDEPEPQPTPTRNHPRRAPAGQRAQQAYAELPTRARTALYTGTAAATGYWIGLAPLMESWIVDCGHDNSPTAAIVLGVGLVGAVGVLIDRRTRGWWGPLPWLCRIPLASALLALALYAPGATP